MVLKARTQEIPFQTIEYDLITTIQNCSAFDIVENPLLNKNEYREISAFVLLLL